MKMEELEPPPSALATEYPLTTQLQGLLANRYKKTPFYTNSA